MPVDSGTVQYVQDYILNPPGPARGERKRLNLVGVADDRLFHQDLSSPLTTAVYVLNRAKIKGPSSPVTLRITGLVPGKRYVDIKIKCGLKSIESITYGDNDG